MKNTEEHNALQTMLRCYTSVKAVQQRAAREAVTENLPKFGKTFRVLPYRSRPEPKYWSWIFSKKFGFNVLPRDSFHLLKAYSGSRHNFRMLRRHSFDCNYVEQGSYSLIWRLYSWKQSDEKFPWPAKTIQCEGRQRKKFQATSFPKISAWIVRLWCTPTW